MSLKLSVLAFFAAGTLGMAQAAPTQSPLPGHTPMPSTTPISTPTPQPHVDNSGTGTWKAPTTSSGQLNQESSLQDGTESIRADNLSGKSTRNAVKNRTAQPLPAKNGGLQSTRLLAPPAMMIGGYGVKPVPQRDAAPQLTFYGGMPFSDIPPVGAVNLDDEDI